jgi:hypothetical protein
MKKILAPVLAVVESGSSSDFFNTPYPVFDPSKDYGDPDLVGFNLYNAEEDEYYAAALANPVASMLAYCCSVDINAGGGSGGSTRTVTSPWVTNASRPAMLTTVWYQRSPFNDACPTKNNKRAPAGCVPIAVSQIMAYHGYPKNYVDWAGVRNIMNITNRSEETGTPAWRAAAATLVSRVGALCETKYTANWSFALPVDAKRCMAALGYSSVTRHIGYKSDKAIDMLKKGNPVFLAGISGSTNGHAWVIDGYIDRSRTIKIFNTTTGALVSTTTEKEVLVHCNWGWQGNCNGYYTSGVFSPENGPAEREEYEARYDAESDRNYTWWFRMLTYNKPN